MSRQTAPNSSFSFSIPVGQDFLNLLPYMTDYSIITQSEEEGRTPGLPQIAQEVNLFLEHVNHCAN